jgi:hypothetical protein
MDTLLYLRTVVKNIRDNLKSFLQAQRLDGQQRRQRLCNVWPSLQRIASLVKVPAEHLQTSMNFLLVLG